MSVLAARWQAEGCLRSWQAVGACLAVTLFVALRLVEALGLRAMLFLVGGGRAVLVRTRAATLDLLSDGRLDFGVGQGYRHSEFAGFCVPTEEAEARFDESLAVILTVRTSASATKELL